MYATNKIKTAKDCYDHYIEDKGCHKYQDFLRESNLARLIVEDRFNMEDLGFERDDKPFVKWNTIRKTINLIFSKVAANKPQATAAPYEGFNTEENVLKICDCIWKFEADQERTHQGLNFDRENIKALHDGLKEGVGYCDSRVDDTIATKVFPLGLTVYESPNPINVIIDRSAGRWEEKNHLHIIHWVHPDDFELIFGKDADELGYVADDIGRDLEKHHGKVRVIETQYKGFESRKLYKLADTQKAELGLDKDYIWGDELKAYLKSLKMKFPEEYAYLVVKDYLKITEFVKNTVQHGWFSWFHVDGIKLHDTPYFMGTDCTINQFSPFKYYLDNSAYGHGIPYFLLEQAKTDMLFGTQALRAVMARRLWMKRMPSEKFISKFNKNKLIDIFAFTEEDGIDPDIPLKDQMEFEDMLSKVPYLLQFWQMLRENEKEEFSTDPSSGKVPFAGISGSAIGKLVAAADVLLTVIVDDYHWFLKRQYTRALRLGVQTIPPAVLLFIAGENDEDRKKLIISGDFYKRISFLNAQVKLDLRSNEEKLFLKQLQAEWFKTGKPRPKRVYEFLGYDEPIRMETEDMEWQLQQNKLLQMAKMIQEDKVLGLVVDNYVKQRDRQAAANQIQQQK